MNWFDLALMTVMRWLAGVPKRTRMAILTDELINAAEALDEKRVEEITGEMVLETIAMVYQIILRQSNRRRRRELRSPPVLGKALYEECDKVFRYQNGEPFPFEIRKSLAVLCGLYADKALAQ